MYQQTTFGHKSMKALNAITSVLNNMENTAIEKALDDLYGRGLPQFKILSMYSEPTINPHTNGQKTDTGANTGSI